MARRDYVVEGALLQCTLGTAPGEMVVTSQQKVEICGKLKATSEDKIPKPPFFGSCTCSSPNPPCSPVLKEWQLTSKGSSIGNKAFLMNNSRIPCEKGGMVTIKDVGQKLVGTGREESELDEKYPELKGEIIFANGYLSDSLGGALNALKDLNPDEASPGLHRGWNANENDPLDESNILLDSELDRAITLTLEEIEKERKEKERKIVFSEEKTIRYPLSISPLIPPLKNITVNIPEISATLPKQSKTIPVLTQQELKMIFWGYWNEIGNHRRGSKTYASYFNAEKNEHFLNGSHGLGSNAAHRLDHGIAQGYQWAMHQWEIIPKEEVDETKEKVPYIESYSPAYKPLTLVMHSQGNAPGVGFALGAMKYANELGWEQIPLNLIFLGVHQPQGLWDDEYKKLLKAKNLYFTANHDFWDAGPWILWPENWKKDRNIYKYMSALSELFSAKHNKLRHQRGIYEHLKAITDFDALKERSVQFTFANDHGDIVCRDGDIPEIDSACNPKTDTTLFSAEFFRKKVPASYASDQNKKVIALKDGGFVVIPPYSAVPRLEAQEINGKVVIHDDWTDYRGIAIDWGNAMFRFRSLKKEHEKQQGRKIDLGDIFNPIKQGYAFATWAALKMAYFQTIYHYGRLQVADLYAHFSPVEFIHNETILNGPGFDDGLGNQNIWERIKKVGEKKFYRVEYHKKQSTVDNMSEEAKRIAAKKYVGKEINISKMTSTSIACNIYIQNVIDAFVNCDDKAMNKLYEEPTPEDIEEIEVDRLIKQFGLTRNARDIQVKKSKNEILRDAAIKKDNTTVDIPQNKRK
ncbi:DUF4280 domain-containing protein [Pricia sp.]|uniref:DUF4280 domain-containing protein n=1 Tax=Pricia sp. TaxID=2268138 RepID=UPI003593A8A7